MKVARGIVGDDFKFDPGEFAKGQGDWAYDEFLRSGSLPSPIEATAYSWLNLRELKEVLKKAKLKEPDLSKEFCKVLATMEKLAKRNDLEKVRLVFATTL